MKPETLQKRAIRAGIKRYKRSGEPITKEDLGSLKVQLVPEWVRIFLAVVGISLLVCGSGTISFENPVWNVLRLVSGTFLLLFAIFGVSKTFDGLFKTLDAGVSNGVTEAIVDGISSVFD